MTNSRPMIASDAAPKTSPSNYPEPFASRVAGRQKQALGDAFGLTTFGVNRTTLKPGALSALRHWHSVQDEFIFILSGHPTLITNSGETTLHPGMCMGFKGGDPDGHHLVNKSMEDVVYLEVGDRLSGDTGSYPDDDLEAIKGTDGKWHFRHKDGSPY